MGYNSKLTNLTNRAFDLLKDLATNATFIRKEGTFDFATGSTELTNSPNKIIKVVALESKSNDGKISLKLLVKYQDILDINQFSKVNINGIEYKINSKYESDGFTTIIEVYRNG
jgi:hypothetical protein